MTQDKPKILIVDDISANLILLETILRKEQADILKSTNGQQALDLAENIDLALIILDVSMPGLNGFELARKLRKQENNKLTPIIFISAILYDQQSISQGYQAGAVDYLTKPFQNEVLISKVKVFLRLYQQNRELQRQSRILSDSIAQYRKAEQTILFKYQLERAVSLASARFSGNFDLIQSVDFMLRDIAGICNAAGAIFKVTNPGFWPDASRSVETPSISGKEIPAAVVSKIENRAQLPAEVCGILAIKNEIKGYWNFVEQMVFDTNTALSLAIPVTIQDASIAVILVENCNFQGQWAVQDICSLGVFGTIAGNALERAKTRSALEESEARYRSYIQNAPEGILVADSLGKIIEANPAAVNMLGFEKETISGIDLASVFKTEMLAGNFAEYKSLTSGKHSQAEFFVSVRKITLNIRAQSVQLPDGLYMVFCSDITAAREMEKHLIHTERMVGIGEMAAGIAHEINQPLNTISFGIDNLFHALRNHTADDAYLNDKAGRIFEGIHRMRTIIDHVRTFSRSTDDYIHAAFSVNEAIKNALSLVQEQFRNHGIGITLKLADDQSVVIQGNTYKLEQVVLNLLSNARDAVEEKNQLALPEFEPSITIETSLIANEVVMLVKDNGTGISTEQLEHITTPFYTTKEPGKGTGLGLAISFGIVRDHKGVMNFISTHGAGTVVELKFPALKRNR